MKRTFSILFAIFSLHSTLRAQEAADYASHLSENAVDPTEYILSKLREYRIVAIGEDHWIADHAPFFCDVLKEAAKNEETRPDIVAVEFGSELDQNTADDVVRSSAFMPDSVIKILHAPPTYTVIRIENTSTYSNVYGRSIRVCPRARRSESGCSILQEYRICRIRFPRKGARTATCRCFRNCVGILRTEIR